MSNHSSYPGDSPIPEFVKRIMDDPLIGATGTHPHGMLTPHDEGGIQFSIGTKDSKVCIDFGTPCTWIGMPPKQAMELAQLLVRHAREAARKTGEVLSFSI